MRKRLLSLLLVFVLVLGMLPASAFAAEYPSDTNIQSLTGVTEPLVKGEDITFLLWSMEMGPVSSYTATVPQGTQTVTLTFVPESYPEPFEDYYTGQLSLSGAWVTYNEDECSYSGDSASHYPTEVGGTHSIELNVAEMIAEGKYYCAYGTSNEPIYLLNFAYAEGGEDTPTTPPAADAPFLSIKIDGQDVAAENIKLITDEYVLGDYDADDPDGSDGWDSVHILPYYQVTVPCGTPSVDVTYSADTSILNSGSDAYGYKTDLEVDAVSSATLRSTTFKDSYTENADGTQTVKTPVTGNTFDAEGNGHAVTLEDQEYAALCLFSFKYEEGTHSFDDAATCSVCGAANPDYVEPGVEIPGDTNIEAITEVMSFAEGDPIEFSVWGTPYDPVSSYIATVPEGTQTVVLTFQEGTYPAPSQYYNYISGGKVYYGEDEYGDIGYFGKGTEHVPTAVGNTHSIELSVADFLYDDENYYAAYDTDNNPIYLLTFQYPVGAHVHSYTEEVTKQPTCTEKGEKTFTCSCSESYTEEIPATGHKFNDWEILTDATCAAAGEKQRVCINGCAEGTEGRVETQTIAKKDHTYGEPVEYPKATCTTEGTKTYTCTECPEGTDGHIKTETVKALGHNYENGQCANGCGETCPLQDDTGAFLIGTYEDLLWFANTVNGGLKDIDGKLTADIILPENWPGIGNSTNKFAGTFDGDGHTVTLSGSVWGLFAYVMGTYNDSDFIAKEYAVVKNVITDGTSTDAPLIHAAGYAKITNCVNKADTTGTNGYIAGIVGSLNYALQYNAVKKNDVRIEDCINEGDIAGTMNVAGILGEGLVGYTVTGCVNTGKITGSGTAVGGIAGFLQSGTITNCYNTGEVSGSSRAGGIVGDAYSVVTISNCYNAGETTYAVVGNVYTNGSASNVYYRADLSDYAAPERKKGYADVDNGYNTTHNGEAMNSANMGSEEFAAMLGAAFKASCGGPVLTWQDSVEHSISENQVCTACHYGLTEATTLTVHKSTGDGYEINGYDTVAKGNAYTFTVDIQDGYEAPDLKVYYNGTALTANEDGEYTVTPTGHFYITVEGIQEMPNVRPIALPKAGDGYRVNPCDGYTTTVYNGADFKFTVEIVEGFKKSDDFEVHVNNAAVDPDNDGIYTISNITEKKTITVHGVETASTASASIGVHITDGPKKFFEAKNINKTGMFDQKVTIPYFDLELYGMQDYYYNPYCYVDEDGNPVTQTAGSREDANGVVTVMHAFIYMTDMFFLGLDEEYAGTGYSDQMDTDGDGTSDFDEAIFWGDAQTVGSTFVNNFWGHPNGGNLNYHVNYEYPLGREDWGSTSDQIKLVDNDVLTIHFIEGNANGSAFGFFAANDTNNTYDRNEQKDYATVKAGESITLTNYIGSQGPNYTTAFITGANKDLYWAKKGEASYEIKVTDEEAGTVGTWHRDGFGNMTAEQFKTDENGVITLDTTDMEPGTYYIANHGQFYQGNGTADSAGFVSNGAEAGPCYFVLTIEEGDAEVVLGDADGDGEVKAADALLVKQYVAEMEVTLNEDAADVDGNGVVQAADALLIEQLVAEIIQEFPAQEQ